jgi:hypothetical protein
MTTRQVTLIFSLCSLGSWWQGWEEGWQRSSRSFGGGLEAGKWAPPPQGHVPAVPELLMPPARPKRYCPKCGFKTKQKGIPGNSKRIGCVECFTIPPLLTRGKRECQGSACAEVLSTRATSCHSCGWAKLGEDGGPKKKKKVSPPHRLHTSSRTCTCSRTLCPYSAGTHPHHR